MFTYGMSVRRALIAGALAGGATALFVALVGEDSIDAAIAIEDAAGGESHHDDPLFSRGAQVVGGISAAVLYGVLMGVVFGTVFAAVRHRLTLATDFGRSLLLAAIGFATTALLPAIKYPANPPAVGDPNTVNQRSIYYFTLLFGAIVFAIAIGAAYHAMRRRTDRASATLAAAALAVVGFAFLMIAWPNNPDSVPADFPATLLWEFRLQSLAGLAILWGVLGLVFGWLNRTRPQLIATGTSDTSGPSEFDRSGDPGQSEIDLRDRTATPEPTSTSETTRR